MFRSKKASRIVTPEQLRMLLTYDPKSGTWMYNKYPAKGLKKREAGTMLSDGYIGITINKRRYLAHRLSYLFMTGRWPPNEVDHVNGNRSDNKWRNLRLATDHYNAWNRKTHKNKKIPLKGVYVVSSRGKKRKNPYAASIMVRGKQIHLGVFPTPKSANLAYIEAAKKFFGRFARIS